MFSLQNNKAVKPGVLLLFNTKVYFVRNTIFIVKIKTSIMSFLIFKQNSS